METEILKKCFECDNEGIYFCDNKDNLGCENILCRGCSISDSEMICSECRKKKENDMNSLKDKIVELLMEYDDASEAPPENYADCIIELFKTQNTPNWIPLSDRVQKYDKDKDLGYDNSRYLLLKKNHYGHYGYKDFNHPSFMSFIENNIVKSDYKNYLWQKIELPNGE